MMTVLNTLMIMVSRSKWNVVFVKKDGEMETESAKNASYPVSVAPKKTSTNTLFMSCAILISHLKRHFIIMLSWQMHLQDFNDSILPFYFLLKWVSILYTFCFIKLYFVFCNIDDIWMFSLTNFKILFYYTTHINSNRIKIL